MKTQKYNSKLIILLAMLLSLCFTHHANSAPTNEEILQHITQIREQASIVQNNIQHLCKIVQTGTPGKFDLSIHGVPGWIADNKLTFSVDTLDSDLDNAVNLLDDYDKIIQILEEELEKRKSTPSKPLSLEERMRLAEAGSTTTFVQPDESFNLVDSYTDEHKRKQALKDKMAEDDMVQVIAERRSAEARLNKQRDIARGIHEQNTRFQAELDAQATKDAELAAEWKRQHSAGAFVKGVFRSLVGGAVTAASGELGRGFGHRIADSVIRDRYPRHDRSYGDSYAD